MDPNSVEAHRAYLEWWDEHFVPLLPPRTHAIVTLCFEVDNPNAFRKALVEHSLDNPDLLNTHYQLLDELPRIDEGHVRTFLRNSRIQLSQADRDREIPRILRQTRGEYMPTVSALSELINREETRRREARSVNRPERSTQPHEQDRAQLASEPRLVFNGINGATGEYDVPPMTAQELSTFITREAKPENLAELRARHRREMQGHLAAREGVDTDQLDQAGWGVVFARDTDPSVLQALRDLLALRKEQAGGLFRLYRGQEGLRPGESKTDFLARHGAGPGPVDPAKVPYYLLLVGSPSEISYRFQYELDVQYAVGRLHFDTPDEYATYARSVVTAEQGAVKLPRQVSFLGVANPDDRATRFTARDLIEPLYRRLQDDARTWTTSAVLREDAVKGRLASLLGGPETPALLMTASHGMGFPLGDPRQLAHQGALLCQDWPGPVNWPHGKPIPQDHYFAGDDIAADARLHGLLAFFFACYGGGTPLNDAFYKQAFKQRTAIAPYPFVARLPQRLLGHPRGGALAVIGHVERAWAYSFLWPKAGAQTVVFESVLDRLLKGSPVGAAMEYMNSRWAEMATVLSDELEEIEAGEAFDPDDLAFKWTANNDARSYVIIGDPAVRLPVAQPGETPLDRPTI
jgi:hypothetical protein